MKVCILKKGKERPVKNKHPWIFSGAIDEVDDGLSSGELVNVFSSSQELLGTGYFNPKSQITVRMLSFDETPVNRNFFSRLISDAILLRKQLIENTPEINAYRIVHSEGDFLPGLIVDRYNDFLAVQFLTAGMERWKKDIVDILANQMPVRGIYERSDSSDRMIEGLDQESKTAWGEEPPEEIQVLENGHSFLVNIKAGQKTGFFLDQRDNRTLVGFLSSGRSVLNCFCYTGGFSVYAAHCGAKSVVSVDSSQPALDALSRNLALNKLNAQQESIREDVFDYLRKETRTFDLIVLDPPAFCKSKQQIERAARGYKDINLMAMKRLSKGGLLFSASCSSFISPEFFQTILFQAAKDAKRDVRIIKKTSHAADHPININHPEGEYLKGCLLVAS